MDVYEVATAISTWYSWCSTDAYFRESLIILKPNKSGRVGATTGKYADLFVFDKMSEAAKTFFQAWELELCNIRQEPEQRF